MAVRPQDLLIYQGDDWAATVTVTNNDGTLPDLTGWSSQSQFRVGIADQVPAIAAELQCTVVPPNGVSLYLSHDQTVLLISPSYLWDMQLTSPAGDVTTLLRGNVDVILEVTREAAPPLFRRRLRREYLLNSGILVRTR